MAFVSVPKDLTKIKNKVVLNLTKRQLYLPCMKRTGCRLRRFY